MAIPWSKVRIICRALFRWDCRSRYAPSQWQLIMRTDNIKWKSKITDTPLKNKGVGGFWGVFGKGDARRGKTDSGNSCPPSDFRCAFFKGAIASDMTVLPLCRLSGGIFRFAQYDVLFFTSSCQCRVSKLACKGLRATIFIRRRHFAKMQKTKVLMR